VPSGKVVIALIKVVLEHARTPHFIRKISLPIPRPSVGIQGQVSLHFG
jgi:hypothetical protein